MKNKKSLDWLRDLDKNHFTSADIAPYMGMDPTTVRLMGRDGRLNCPTIVNGTRVRFPKIGFIKAAEKGKV